MKRIKPLIAAAAMTMTMTMTMTMAMSVALAVPLDAVPPAASKVPETVPAKASAKAPAATRAKDPAPNPASYPAADEKEWGQLLWVLKLANQELDDFSNFQSVDEQGVSACRYTIAFSAYFLAAEQYHKFPAWREEIQKASDRLIQRLLQKRVWEYWERESPGVTKFEPKEDRPYPAAKDPVAYRNIMYSGHLSQMINLYQSLYGERKWDAPGSIVLKWDDATKFTYDNRTLQDAMFLQLINNPVPGIECEPNAIFPACNTHPMLGWLLYDRMHGTRYYAAAQPLFDRFFADQFINPKTKQLGAFYLLKQGWTFSAWNPRYGNSMDPLIRKMVDAGANFDSSGNDGWVATFMHGWNPKVVESLYPYMKKDQVRMNADGSATLKNDSLTPDAYYGFFLALAAEVGDTAVRDGLLKSVDRMFAPTWKDGTYHYPFVDKAGAVNLAADDGAKKAPAAPPGTAAPVPPATPASTKADEKKASGGLCCKGLQVKGQGDANNMKTLPQHSDVTDRLIALARSLPKNGIWTMHNKPFDEAHFAAPYVTGIDPAALPLRRALWDAKAKALVVTTRGVKDGPARSFTVRGLDKAKSYRLTVDAGPAKPVSGVDSAVVDLPRTSTDHDVVLTEAR